jgi:hypothetical protein
MVGCYYNHADKESALNECSPLAVISVFYPLI